MTAYIILAAATLLRLLLPLIRVEWSRADETVQARLALSATRPRYDYRRACEEWLRDEKAANWPGIIRWANVLGLAALYRLFRANTYFVPQGVSTAASVVTLWSAWWLAGGGTVAALAVAASPLQLHLGRRALQDAGVCALTLLALAALSVGQPIAAAFVLAALLAYKETAAPAFPAVAAYGWVVGMAPLTLCGVLVGAVLLYWAGTTWLTRDPLMLWRMARRVTQARHDDYGREQEGAPHRLAVDLFLLSPVACVCAVRGDWNAAAVFTVALLAVQTCFPILRSVRMVTAADAMMRVAAVAVAGPWVALAILVSDLTIFWWVFHRKRVYDPTTKELVSALGMTAR